MPEMLHFSAEWCQPCKMMVPVVSKFLDQNTDIKYTKIDIDKFPDLKDAYNVKGVPTFIAVDGEEVIGRVVGAVPVAKLEGIFGRR